MRDLEKREIRDLKVLGFVVTLGLTIVPYLRTPFGTHMLPVQDSDKLSFLAIIIALSAYVTGLRLALIGRFTHDRRPAHPLLTKFFIMLLIPADASLIVSGFSMLVILYGTGVFSHGTIYWMKANATPFFIYGVIILMANHIINAVFTVYHYWRTEIKLASPPMK